MATITDLLKHIVEAMVDYPEEVQITEVKGGHTTILELKVAKADIGKIIGKKGNNVQAIRDILFAASGKSKKRVMLEIME
jgi:uncharacterized protein